MKFLCIDCDAQMTFEDRQVPGDGTFAASFTCPSCGRKIAMLTNPAETQLVSSLGVKIGNETVPSVKPLELIETFVDPAPVSEHRPIWDEAAVQRLKGVPSFVRGMVKRIYSDYATERGIARITPAVMDQARADLGLEDM